MISALLYLYPAAWRAEYGPELIHMLRARPITARVIADLIWNGFRERAHAADTATYLGLGAMSVLLLGFVSNFVSPPHDNWGLSAVLGDSFITWPRIVVKPLRSGLYDLLLILCGCWTYLRGNSSVSQSGRAAVRATFIAGIPVIVAGILMLSGFLNFVAVWPGSAASLPPHGLTYTYLTTHPWQIAQRIQPSLLDVILAPVFGLPQAWIWGMVGGWLGTRLSPLVGNRLVRE